VDKSRLHIPVAFLLALEAGFCTVCKTKDNHVMPVSAEEYIRQAEASGDSKETKQMANEERDWVIG
jgi:hypothetical protein